MKAGTLFVALVVAGACIAGIVWLAGGSGPMGVANSAKVADIQGFEISKTGPHPKAVLPETVHDFDVMGSGAEKSHKFIIKNEGEAPLEYKLKGTTCSCTVSDMKEDEVYTIPVGEQAEVELKWTPPGPEPDFAKHAEIYTNDPENSIVTFTVKGRVEEMVMVNPEGGWTLQNLERTKPETLTAEIVSGILDEFKIKSVEASSENIQTEVEPISEEELNQGPLKAGYRITATFNPKDLKIGKISETVTVHTDIKGSEKISLPLKGQFSGSITGLPYLPEGESADGRKWVPQILHLNLGAFSSTKGRKGWYKMAVGDMPESTKFEVTDIKSSDESVTASVEPLPTPPNSTRQFLLVTFQVKPGIPPKSVDQDKAVEVILKTNHPYAPEIKFSVVFQAL